MDSDMILTLLQPVWYITMSAYFIPHTIFNLVLGLNVQPLLSFSSFKDHWFARFWTWYGPISQTNSSPQLRPMLAEATGTILEVGPGQGHFLPLYAQSPNRSKITKVYAVEPNKGHHPGLLANAKKAGLEDIFEILDSTIETLESKAGIKRYSIDTIVTLQVLCSINDPEDLIKELRTYLKPDGGKWIVYEHVRRHDNGGTALYQSMVNMLWPTFFNGCHLTRPSDSCILRSGGWDMQKSGGGLKKLETDSTWSVIPTVKGVLVSQST